MMTAQSTLKPQIKHSWAVARLELWLIFGDANLMLDFLGERPWLPSALQFLEGVSSWQRSGESGFEDPCLLCGSQTTGLQQA